MARPFPPVRVPCEARYAGSSVRLIMSADICETTLLPLDITHALMSMPVRHSLAAG